MTIDTKNQLALPVPSMAQLILDAINDALYNLHTGLPAKVVSFDPKTQSVVVQPLLRRVFAGEDRTAQAAVNLPQIHNVPVQYESGGGWSITFPLVVNDIVYLAFAERSLDRWLDSADPTTPLDPVDARKHDLTDAVAIPGLRARKRAIPNISATDLRVAHESGSVVLVLKPGGEIELSASAKIKLGSTATRGVARLQDQIKVDSSTDLSFTRWATAAHVFMTQANSLATLATANATYVATVQEPVVDVTGKIITASDKVHTE